MWIYRYNMSIYRYNMSTFQSPETKTVFTVQKCDEVSVSTLRHEECNDEVSVSTLRNEECI